MQSMTYRSYDKYMMYRGILSIINRRQKEPSMSFFSGVGGGVCERYLPTRFLVFFFYFKDFTTFIASRFLFIYFRL